MAIRIDVDGPCFGTSVKDGLLNIELGYDTVSIPFKFLKEDFPYHYASMPVSNIMCYLENEEHVIIMRFDGTATKYQIESNIVVGFWRFNKDILSEYIGVLSNGSYIKQEKIEHPMIRPSTIWVYFAHKSDNSCIGFLMQNYYMKIHNENNKQFIVDVLQCQQMYPLLYVGDTLVEEHSGRYEVVGHFVIPEKHVGV